MLKNNNEYVQFELYYWLFWLLFHRAIRHCGSYISDHLNTSLSEALFWQELIQSKIHSMFNTLAATKFFHCVLYVDVLKKVVEFLLKLHSDIFSKDQECVKC